MVLVLRSGDRAAGVGCQESESRPRRAALHRLHQNPADVHFRGAGHDLSGSRQQRRSPKEPLADPKDTLTYLINHTLPTGMIGIMAAALLAAMMGSVSAALNSIATVFSYDIVKRHWPETSEKTLVFTRPRCHRRGDDRGDRLVAVRGAIRHDLPRADRLIYMAPPITAVFLLGVFWRRLWARRR